VSPIDHDCTPQERNVLLARIAELEAEVEQWHQRDARGGNLTYARLTEERIAVLEQGVRYEETRAAALLNRAEQAEAALAERDRMLKEAYDDYVCGRLDGDPPFMEAPEWLADLKVRAEEGSLLLEGERDVDGEPFDAAYYERPGGLYGHSAEEGGE
jgi:hypothetical protein